MTIPASVVWNLASIAVGALVTYRVAGHFFGKTRDRLVGLTNEARDQHRTTVEDLGGLRDETREVNAKTTRGIEMVMQEVLPPGSTFKWTYRDGEITGVTVRRISGTSSGTSDDRGSVDAHEDES